MDPVADVIAVLSLVVSSSISSFTLWRQRQEQKRRLEWEQHLVETQRRQRLEESQPELRAVGSSLRYASHSPRRLAADAADQEVELQNVGSSMPRDVRAVLFMPEPFITMNSSPPQQVSAPANPYWQGSLAASIAPQGQRRITLTPARAPLQGNQVIGNQTLFPPLTPAPQRETSLGAGPVEKASSWAGRLTVTYRDQAGRKLAGTFDLDAETGDWSPGIFQPDIKRDLVLQRHLADQGP